MAGDTAQHPHITATEQSRRLFSRAEWRMLHVNTRHMARPKGLRRHLFSRAEWRMSPRNTHTSPRPNNPDICSVAPNGGCFR